MRQLHTFDEVFDSQRLFRGLLDSMANPGRRCRIDMESKKMFGEYPEILAVAMTLLDTSVSFHIFGNQELEEQVVLLTHARQRAGEEADFLFVLEPEWLEKTVAGAKSGTLENPHASATVIIKVPEGEAEKKVCLRGPGVDGHIDLTVPAALVRAVRLRDQQEYEYPRGIDLIFLLPGEELMCIPRLVKMEEY